MLFSFIRYTQPAWQFNISAKADGCFPSCYPGETDISEGILDDQYEAQSARLADMGYRLWNKGVLLESTHETIECFQKMPKPTLNDEYHFIKKFWGTAWTVFALLIRLFTFKNPVKELRAFYKTRKTRQINGFDNPVKYDNYDFFQSKLIQEQPLVAVIIPTLNRYTYLKDVLHDLENQVYKNFEVIVVDQSDNFEKDFYNGFKLHLQAIHQKEKKLWTARNIAITKTKAQFLLFFDDDSRVETAWISEHLKCLDYFEADISAGVSLAAVGQKISKSYNFFRWADQFDSGNAMIKRSVMQQVGMFDEQFNGQRMGDGEFGFRAYQRGYRSISNPKAFRVHLKVSSGGLREMGSWDGFRPKKWFAPKPVPSVIYSFKKYFPPYLFHNAIFIGMLLSNIPYKYKRSSSMLLLSVFLTILKSPLLLFQYSKSVHLANKMLKQGDYIPSLDT